jgi:hypothetical protein
MANVIEALFITLGLDTREYQKSQKEVGTSLKKLGETSDKQTKLIAEHGKKAAGAFSALKIEILGALAAFGMGAGFKAFIESSITGQATLGRMSTTLGMSTHQLQAWRLAAKEMGGAGNEASDALQSMAKGMAEAKIHGTSALIQASRRFGFGVSNDPAQTLINISRRMAEMHDPQQALQVAEAAGISNFTMQQMLLQGPDKLQAQLARTMALTGAATKASTEQAAKLQAQWADLQERFHQVGQRVFDKLEPVLARLGEELANWLDSIDWNAVIRNVEKFFQALQQVVQALGGVKGILIEIAAVKVFGWIANVGMWVLKLRSLTTALTAARAAAAAGGAAGAAEAAAAGGGAGLAAKAIPLATRVSMWALPIWALFHSESTGGARRADGTYEDEVSSAQLAATAKTGREMEAKHRAQAMAYFTSQGWTPQQAAGIVANLTAESGLRTNAYGDNMKAYGIAQWHKDRQQAFEKFTGRPIQGSSFADQLAFVNHELQTSEKRAGDRLRTAGSAADAASLVSLLYERPAGGQAEALRRAKMAQGLSSAYVGARPEVAKSGSSTTTNSVTINGPINVQTKATDANGVAKGMQKALQNNPLIAGYVTSVA